VIECLAFAPEGLRDSTVNTAATGQL
jgi:hypothetical protein